MANKVSNSVAVPGKQSRNERIEEFLREHYAFRYNTVKSRAEFRSSDGEFLPVTKYRLNSFRRELDRTIGISTSAEEPAQHARKRLFRACESRASVFS